MNQTNTRTYSKESTPDACNFRRLSKVVRVPSYQACIHVFNLDFACAYTVLPSIHLYIYCTISPLSNLECQHIKQLKVYTTSSAQQDAQTTVRARLDMELRLEPSSTTRTHHRHKHERARTPYGASQNKYIQAHLYILGPSVWVDS